MTGQPFWRISPSDLEKLMAALEISSVNFSECILSAGAHVAVALTQAPMMHYSLSGDGLLLIGSEPAIEIPPHTFVVTPRNMPVTILAPRYGSAPTPRAAGIGATNFLPGSKYHHKAGDGEPALRAIFGHFHAVYGGAFDLFGSLSSPVVEKFKSSDRVGQIMNYMMAELSSQEVGGASMSKALFKLALLVLLRRSLISAHPWVERFSLLSDPAIARAFADMAARPSAVHTVRSLSQSVGLSRSAFMARFATAFRESPMVVLRRLRMRQAANLLATHAPSIDQVAAQAGYQSRSSFTRTFRKLYGSDPSEFRATAKRLALVGAVTDTHEAMLSSSRLPATRRS